MNENELIRDNIFKHEQIASRYNERHAEIYNEIEQRRLFELIKRCVQITQKEQPTALDFGCGSGNLTQHLLNNDCFVTVADVTPSFVKISAAIDPTRTKQHILNGRDLHEFSDFTFDLVATYSVLHHIPDYLFAVKELVRVTKPGGLIIIDHEACDRYWTNDEMLNELRAQTKPYRSLLWYASRVISPRWWIHKWRKTISPRYSVEGDIHVWPDDHIEWDEIRYIFNNMNVDIIIDEDYLLYQPHYPIDIYNKFKNRTSDVHVLVGRKH